MQKSSKQEIAIIENGKIIATMPKASYDADIIGQYKIATQNISNSSNGNPSQSDNAVFTYNPPKTNTVQTVGNDPLGDMLQEKMVKPFQTFAILFAGALVLTLIYIYWYKSISGKAPSKEAVGLVKAIFLGVAFLIFIKYLI